MSIGGLLSHKVIYVAMQECLQVESIFRKEKWRLVLRLERLDRLDHVANSKETTVQRRCVVARGFPGSRVSSGHRAKSDGLFRDVRASFSALGCPSR
jgi:hypothetical protein